MSKLTRPYRLQFTLAALGLLAAASLPAADGISNLRSSQRVGTNLVDIYYDLSTSASSPLLVAVSVSTNGGLAYDLPATHFTGDVGAGVTAGTNKWIVWDARRDWPDRFSTNICLHLTATGVSPVVPPGMVLIPAGSFVMGDTFGEGDSDELPLHTVYVSAFYMDKNLVSYALWQQVYSWAMTNGYSFDTAGSGKAANHPVQYMTWYDAVKWCNARSEQEGRVPAYYTDAGLIVPYRAGQTNVQSNWASGYRLPTEAEWEKAARGGASGQRFPWADTDNISHSQANYYAGYSFPYNLSYPTTYHPTFATGGNPYTSSVGYFPANGYGLYDMAGNVWQWCWDWFFWYSSGLQTDPRGSSWDWGRVVRGGSWGYGAVNCRAANRDRRDSAYRDIDLGFRSVLPPCQ